MGGEPANVMSPETLAPADALRGKLVFVLGGSAGMGEAIASLAAASGARVAIAARSGDRLAAVSDRLGDRSAGYHCLDMADEDAVGAALRSHDTIDHIVITAASLSLKPYHQLQRGEIEAMLGSKFWGPLHVARAASSVLSAQGSITLFSGVAAYRQNADSAVLGGLNHYLESFAAGLAQDLAPRRVNVISPGVTDTSLWSHMDEATRAAFFADVAGGLPVRRVGTVADIAHAALAVMSNGFINGTVVHVDGGARIV